MSLLTPIVSRAMGWYTGEPRQARRRQRLLRARPDRAHVLQYFHQVDDPYSHLAAQALAELYERYAIEIELHLVEPPADWAAPERALLADWSLRDATLLARRAGLVFAPRVTAPEPSACRAAVAAIGASDPGPGLGIAALACAIRAGEALWAGDHPRAPDVPAHRIAEQLRAGSARRDALGHFMSGMIRFAGDWYWGVDRLHHLERQLQALGLSRKDVPPPLRYAEAPFNPHPTPWPSPAKGRPATGRVLHFYLSFRSPYTAVAVPRVAALAQASGATLALRFVLPMIMRGLPVPRRKGLAFALDAAREARYHGLPFGRIADPLG
ncbi:MAG: 2-hydroxychromene-2-carboxylate isomerase, partial [Gammaproteobacteria bacterium]